MGWGLQEAVPNIPLGLLVDSRPHQVPIVGSPLTGAVADAPLPVLADLVAALEAAERVGWVSAAGSGREEERGKMTSGAPPAHGEWSGSTLS